MKYIQYAWSIWNIYFKYILKIYSCVTEIAHTRSNGSGCAVDAMVKMLSGTSTSHVGVPRLIPRSSVFDPACWWWIPGTQQRVAHIFGSLPERVRLSPGFWFWPGSVLAVGGTCRVNHYVCVSVSAFQIKKLFYYLRLKILKRYDFGAYIVL